jgi:hypothetical protein
MFNSQQKHIINKLQVDVVTQNPSTAFDLKDHLDSFLKHEIFPYLESYFATIEEELQDQIIQIPYLSVDINTSTALHYNELKEDVKRALVKKLEELTKKAHPQNEEATLLTTAKSKENQFLHFLEKGTLTWWNHSEDAFEVSEQDFERLITSASFSRLIKQKLMKKVVKKRIIQQLSDVQLKSVWDVLVQERTSVTISSEVVSLLPQVSVQLREVVWNSLIDFAIQNDTETLISRLLFALADEVPEAVSEEHVSKIQALNVKNPSLRLISNLLIAMPKNERVTKALRILQKHQTTTAKLADPTSVDRTNEKEAENKKAFQEKSQLTATDPEKTSDVSEEHRQKHVQESNATEDLSDTDLSTDLKANKIKDQKISEQEEVQNKSLMDQPLKEGTEESQKSLDAEGKTETRSEASQEKSQQKTQQAEGTSAQAQNENKDKREVSRDADATASETEHQEESVSKEVSKRKTIVEGDSNKIDSEGTETASSKRKASAHFEGQQDQESLPNESQLSSEKEQERSRKDAVDSEETSTSAKELSESLHALVDEQDQKLFKELHKSQLENPMQMEEKGDYQISNAGLMMLHPYFEQLFENCGLLDNDRTIKNPDLAVHLLHYVATKKEQQFESNMLFEKMLCGVHSSTVIQRSVVLSEEHKNNAEQLLEAVLEHWGVLKNSSPDLLRYEFLQRLGTISFKETNPKIKVERKVQDILLERLPWGIGICRLPWLDYLLFTDWQT